METEALIRYACVTEEHLDSEGIAFDYLEAIDRTGLGARVMPLGALDPSVPPWSELGHLFLSALRMRFINVVCAPAGLPLIRFGLRQDNRSALTCLLTVGIPNVFICTGFGDYSEREVATLRLYNQVITPTAKGAAALDKQGVRSMVIPPDRQQLFRLFSGMNPV